MQDYYNRGAAEYELIYRRDDQVRQAELEAITTAMQAALEGGTVLEVACGTGYWTERLVPAARSVVASDASEEMLRIAGTKALPADRVEFLVGDAYDLNAIPGEFDAALANFWLSHVPRARVAAFLQGLHARIGTSARVFMADNMPVDGVGGDLVRPHGSEDTYKRRILSDGSRHLVLKNYYTGEELGGLFGEFASRLEVHVGSCYWWLSYRVG